MKVFINRQSSFMKSIIVCLLFVFSVVSYSQNEREDVYLFSYFIGNGEDGLHLAYSYDGLNWLSLNEGKTFLTPQLGKDKLMRDPSIVVSPEGTFRLVWTTGWWDKTIGTSSSKDLIHWEEKKIIPVMMHEPATKNSWAPDLFYDDMTSTYYIVWASTIPNRHSEVADTPSEKELNHRQYFTTTKDFKTFTPTQLFFNPTFNVIDATIVYWKDRYWMIVKNENPNPPEKNLRVTSALNIANGFPTEVSPPITGDYWAEGPTTLIIGDYLYVYFDKYTEGKYGALRTKDGVSWEDISDQISFPKGVRHGTTFRVSSSIFEKIKSNK